MSPAAKSVLEWEGRSFSPGERGPVEIRVEQRAIGHGGVIPAYVWVGAEPGPTVFVSGAVHGDEINGTGALRELVAEPPFDLKRGSLLIVPVINIPGFERHERYLPDRRDLNRSFPGSAEGSATSRLARVIFQEIVGRCDFGIDLHTAAVRRTNVPNIRGDFENAEVFRLAHAFGTELALHSVGAEGSLRRTATESGCPTIILEAGETLKVEPTVVETALRGIRNVLIELNMVDGDKLEPSYRAVIRRTRWVRAEFGGFLRFHASPGEWVENGQLLATNTDLLGVEQGRLHSPDSGVLLGMRTNPMVVPGDAIFHLGLIDQPLERFERAVEDLADDSLYERVRDHLSTNVTVDQLDEEDPRPPDSDTE